MTQVAHDTRALVEGRDNAGPCRGGPELPKVDFLHFMACEQLRGDLLRLGLEVSGGVRIVRDEGIGTSSRPARGGGDGNHGPTYASVLADVGVVSESPARSRCERTKLPEGQAELVGGNTSRASATPLT